MPSPFATPQIDFTALQQLGTIPQRLRMRGLRNDFASGKFVGPNGELDYNKMMQAIGGVDPMAAAKMAQSTQGAAGASVYGTPIYGEDPNTGETVLGVIGRDGTFRRLDTGGVNITPGVQFLNQGTQFQPVDKRTARPVGEAIPIDVAGQKGAQIAGESAGKAQVNMPLVENATRRILSTIERIENAPGLESAVGPIESRLPTIREETANVEADIKKATSGGFLQMYEQLRGGGAITEAEGAKASGALFKLESLKQGDAAYKEALKEAKFEVFELLNVARRKAGMQPLQNPYRQAEQGGGLRESDAVNQAKQAIQSNQMTVEQAVQWLRSQGIEVEDDR